MMLVPRDKVPAVEELLAPIFNNHRMPMPSDEQALVWNDEWEDIIRKLED